MYTHTYLHFVQMSNLYPILAVFVVYSLDSPHHYNKIYFSIYSSSFLSIKKKRK